MRLPQQLALALLLCACTARPRAQGIRVHDSAGVRIVENPSVATLPVRFKLAAAPDFMVGGVRDNPSEELDTRNVYVDAVRLSGNRLLVNDVDKIKLFDANGKLLKVFGRGGAGPGEFLGVESICRFRGDSLLVWDIGNGRISIWASDGNLAREYVPSGFASGAGACTDNGSIFVDGVKVESSQVDRPLASYVLLSTGGKPIATTKPMSATLYSGAVMRGVEFASHGGRSWFGDHIALGATMLDGSGKVTEIFRTADRPDPITSADYAARATMRVCDGKTGVCTTPPTKAKTWPAYVGMKVDDEGRAWFHLNSYKDSVWVAFDSTGRTIGKLMVPLGDIKNRREVVRFGNGDVIISDLDSDGAQRISVYRIVALP